MRRAKILATLGPTSQTQEQISDLIRAGANAVRISMSHGSRDDHEAMLNNARRAALEQDAPLSVLIDLAGPKIRTRSLKDKSPVLLQKGEKFVLTTKDIVGNGHEVGTNFSELPHVAEKGSQILLDDGSLELKVLDTNDTDVICEVVSGGLLYESKGINLPGTHLPIPSLTEKDRDDLNWALDMDVDYIALSFVRRASDCTEVKVIINEKNKRNFGRALLVAKIEKAEAIENLDEIIEATDGLMVARGDLGVETSVEKVPVYQKEIIRKSIARDKFVITATQMLQTMIDNPRPTRAEASDVANAVWDGTDAVMLSAETAAGSYPVETVRTMAKIIESSESIRDAYRRKSIKFSQEPSGRTSQALCKAAGYCAQEIKTTKVAVFTESGLMARRLSSFRSGLQTYALTTSWRARNQLALIWGVRAYYQELTKSTEDMLKKGESTLLNNEAVEAGETIVMMAGRLSGLGLSSSVVVWTIGENVPRR
ncbi:MAG: pyruvate kinase [Acidobacteria bacterium]|nr:MAG: pyruvate kinase [Acidobacteriota bacterium]REK04077.1 MAG: pyruvate kinase [Acidobacteriota bacterium]REK15239.1 MAG: pyruvate kinase [Acidobacteriota bacterium]REK46329.1 MAG: pyruvate kinase [Acidobacteriota bacterium]